MVNGLVVFSCCIKQLQFGECVTLVCCKRAMFVTVQTVLISSEGGDGQLDPVCKEAVTAVDDAY